jgi:CBS domain-containing protein
VKENTMSVRDLLKRKESKLITVEPATPLREVARLMMKHRIGGVPVVGVNGTAIGFVAEREIVRAVDEMGDRVKDAAAEKVMRPPPTCTPEDTMHEAMTRMTRERVRHLVVVEGGRPIDVISVGDMVKHRVEQLETEASVLRDYVAAQRAST